MKYDVPVLLTICLTQTFIEFLILSRKFELQKFNFKVMLVFDIKIQKPKIHLDNVIFHFCNQALPATEEFGRGNIYFRHRR